MIGRISNTQITQKAKTNTAFGKGALVMRKKDIISISVDGTESNRPMFEALKTIMTRAKKNRGFKKAFENAPNNLEIRVERSSLSDWGVLVGVSKKTDTKYRDWLQFHPTWADKKEQTSVLRRLTSAVKKVSAEITAKHVVKK